MRSTMFRRSGPLAMATVVSIGAMGVERAARSHAHVTAHLVTATSSLVPGESADVAIQISIERGWHIYWDGLNDSGFPLSVEWTLPPGFKAGEIRWPAPTRHISPGDILDHVYENEVTLIVPVQVPADAAPGSSPAVLSGKLTWLVCKDVCVPESQSVSLNLPIANKGAKPEPSGDAPIIRKALSRLPRPIPPKDNAKVTFEWSADRVDIQAAGASEVLFYPGRESARLSNPIRDAQAKGARMSLELVPAEGEKSRTLKGILEVRFPSGPADTAYYEVDMPGKK